MKLTKLLGLTLVVSVLIMSCLFTLVICFNDHSLTCRRSSSVACSLHPWWYSDNGKHNCPEKHFHITGMPECQPWLTCADLGSIHLKELIGLGSTKAVYRAEWNNVNLSYSILNAPNYKNDFIHGLQMLINLNPSQFVVQLVGFCHENYVILTEYHKHGNAINITHLISSKGRDGLLQRLELCLNYAQLLEYLHNSPVGTRVFCDSNDLVKLLSQLLVTADLTLVLNDLDALPVVDKKNNFRIKCGHKIIASTFVAPEQRWNFDEPYDDTKILGYDEKTDIWKSVSVCKHFLGNKLETNVVASYYLFPIHKSCRSRLPQNRPSATTLVMNYLNLIEVLKK